MEAADRLKDIAVGNLTGSPRCLSPLINFGCEHRRPTCLNFVFKFAAKIWCSTEKGGCPRKTRFVPEIERFRHNSRADRFFALLKQTEPCPICQLEGERVGISGRECYRQLHMSLDGGHGWDRTSDPLNPAAALLAVPAVADANKYGLAHALTLDAPAGACRLSGFLVHLISPLLGDAAQEESLRVRPWRKVITGRSDMAGDPPPAHAPNQTPASSVNSAPPSLRQLSANPNGAVVRPKSSGNTGRPMGGADRAVHSVRWQRLQLTPMGVALSGPGAPLPRV